ncbi:BBSome-interacting protein 1 isoform X1 [Manis pentadactyla]|uniref:BBSome-interacting protein 1 isoform X1 n=1 Tax=Manis pentadactyla TaxID=143292 RepID=UPI0018754A9A|nr:BBSome-interacting protein 1 isoform X1 [Manis pentadactyla]
MATRVSWPLVSGVTHFPSRNFTVALGNSRALWEMYLECPFRVESRSAVSVPRPQRVGPACPEVPRRPSAKGASGSWSLFRSGQVSVEDITTMVLCKPKLLPLKSLTLEKLEKMQQAAQDTIHQQEMAEKKQQQITQ